MRPCTAFLLILLSISISLSQNLWTDDGIALRQGDEIEWNKSAVLNSQGETCVVWSDTRDGLRRVYAQKLSADSQPLWSDEGVLVSGEEPTAGNIAVAAAVDNGFIIAWSSESWASGVGYIKTQKLDSEGERLWGDEGITVSGVTQYPALPQILSDNEGGGYILWANSFLSIAYASSFLSDGTLAPGWVQNGVVISEYCYWSAPKFCSDGASGFIAVWRDGRIPGDAQIYAQRMNPDGAVQWTPEGVPVCSAANEQSDPQITEDVSGGAFIVWEDKRNMAVSNEDIYIQRINANGQCLFQNDGVLVIAQHWMQENPRIVTDAAGGVYVAWEDNRNSLYGIGNVDIYAQRIDGQGNLVWQNQGIPVSMEGEDQINVSIASDRQGGFLAVWQDARNGSIPFIDIYAQRMNAGGGALWSINGIPICQLPYLQENPFVFSMNNFDAAFFWADFSVSCGISMQRSDLQGNIQFPAGGVPLITGIISGVEDFSVINFTANTFLSVWEDFRRTYTGSQIYFQISAMDGNPLLLDNGISVSTAGNSIQQESVQAAVTSDGNAVIVWEDTDNATGGIQQICAQKVDEQGNLLWNPRGIFITSTVIADQMTPYVSADDNGGAFVVWSGYDENYFLKALIQRVDAQGNQLWGDNGVEISTSTGIDEYVAGMVPDGEGNVIAAWLGGTFTDGYRIFAARVLASGDTSWVKTVCGIAGNNETPVIIPSLSGGAVIAWGDYRNSLDFDIYIQKIDNSGESLWQNDGLPVIEYPAEQRFPQIVEDSEGFVYVGWSDNRGDLTFDVYCQRISPQGTLQFSAAGLPAAAIAQSDQWQNKMISDGEGGVYISWEDQRNVYSLSGSDIYAIHLDSDGNIADPVWLEYGNPVCDYSNYQSAPQLVSDGSGGAVVVWKDRRSAGFYGWTDNLYAQRINDFSTGVEDNHAQAVPIRIAFNCAYPNPFNPSTTVSFTLPVEGEVSLKVYDIAGREVQDLGFGIWDLGTHSVVWDAKGCASGVYFVQLTVDGGQSSVKKIVLMK